MVEVNPICWFGNRQLDIVPIHFIKSNTKITNESYMWVLSKLSGRFSVESTILSTKKNLFLHDDNYIFFEDPKEAMMYELRWSGN